MGSKTVSINVALETIESLDVNAQAYISEILSKRIVELRRAGISKRAQEAEQSYKRGTVKRGNIEDLWKDLND
ncbi:hypothetical protein KKE26_07975 [bacterium]|nr:hypothetical protein [bacterium]